MVDEYYVIGEQTRKPFHNPATIMIFIFTLLGFMTILSSHKAVAKINQSRFGGHNFSDPEQIPAITSETFNSKPFFQK